jgi:hypothetical protein
VRLGFATADRTGKSKSAAPRRGAALLGVFAILLQAALFAGHHHPLPLSSPGAPAVLAAATGQEAPELADDDCPICFALSHNSASPVDFLTPPPPGQVALPAAAVAAVDASVAAFLHFRSRAPPRA